MDYAAVITDLEENRSALLALAADFATVARRASGAQLRELLTPWLADAVVDKANRKLILTIHRVPAVAPFLHLCAAPGPDARKQDRRLIARRTIPLPPQRIRRSA